MYITRNLFFVCLAPVIFCLGCSDRDPQPTSEWQLVTEGSIFGGDVQFQLDGSTYWGLGHLTIQTLSANPYVLRFDDTTESWNLAMTYPSTRTKGTMALALNGKVYIGGGFHPKELLMTRELFEYDPSTAEWTEKESIPETASVWTSLNKQNRGFAKGSSTPFYEYLAGTDSWQTTSSAFPDNVRLTGLVADGKEYCLSLDYLWLIDPSSGNWVQKTPTPQAMQYAFVIKERLYAGSGGGGFWMYDAIQEEWIEQPDCPVDADGLTIFGFSAGNIGYVATSTADQSLTSKGGLYRFVLKE